MKKVKLTRLLFVLLCFISVSIKAQNFPGDYVSRIWTASDGLPGNTITDIIQDKKGYIYIGTYDGLVRFDGYDFTILNKNTVADFKCVSARAVLEDSNGIIWVGSNDEGVARIDGDIITIYTTAQGIPNNSIRDIVEDKQGNIWVGTAAGLVFITPTGNVVTPIGLDSVGDANPLVVSLYCDTAGRIWLSTQKAGGVYSYSAGTFSKYKVLDKYGEVAVTSITQDSTGAFWFGLSQKGAVRVDEGQTMLFDESNGLSTATVNNIYQDKSLSIWFGTEVGVHVYKEGKFYHYTEKDGLTNNNVKKIIEDREGNIWLATDRGGVEKMSMGKFRTQTLSETVNAIAEDNNVNVWVGTDNGLRCYYKNDELNNTLTEMCKGLRIRHIEVVSNGDVLISTYAKKGIIRYGKNGIKNWTTTEGLAGNKVRVSLEDHNKNIWVGTTTGLSVISPKGEIKNYYRADGLNNDYIMCLYEDSDNRIWVGTDGGGINIIEEDVVSQSITTDNNLAGNVVFKIMQDDSGIFWICTGTGISRYDGNTFFNYNANQGLGTDSVFQMLIDYTNTVWMTSNRGISSVSLDDMNQVVLDDSKILDPKFFNKNDGLRSGGITSTSLSMRDSLGRLWFTLIDGYAVYDPVKVKSNRTVPLIHVEQVSVDAIPVKDISSKFVVPAGTKRIDIKYTGLSFISSEMIRFKYILEGFDSEYSTLSSTRLVSYTNLKPGNYIFKVMASNSDGVWSEVPAEISFVQRPFYYQTWWFWISVGLMVFMCIVLIIIMREQSLKRTQIQLETMVNMKTVDLEIEKDNSDRLLRNILPDSIATRLKRYGNETIADKFDEVTVLFADIVTFTEITAHQTPEDIVLALNDLFTRFDVRANSLGVEKIKTIGDAYMAVCGMPEPNENHASIMVKFAHGMLKDLENYNKTAKIPFQIRIGINSGSVVAGVIGKTKFIYDLWGDTVNVASRMESLCRPGEILVTEAVKERVEGGLTFKNETECEVKGKGTMRTFVSEI